MFICISNECGDFTTGSTPIEAFENYCDHHDESEDCQVYELGNEYKRVVSFERINDTYEGVRVKLPKCNEPW